MAEAIKINATLTKLDLGLNNIGKVGATAITDALKINTTLTRLDLSFNNIGPDGIAAILRQIPLESALTDFCCDTSEESQENINLTIGAIKTEKEALDVIDSVSPQPIVEALAQYFTRIDEEPAQKLLIDPTNDISRGLAYVNRRRLAKQLQQETASSATLASNNNQDNAQALATGKRKKKQDNPAKRQRLN